MRVFTNFIEAKNEIARDLNELGTTVFAGYQSKSADELDPEKFTTKELQNYDYRVLSPKFEDLEPQTPEWAAAEWEDRLRGIMGEPSNPGTAWKSRPEVWEPLLEADGRFSYTYSERLAGALVGEVIKALKANTQSRQAFIPIWNSVDALRLGSRRVPCTLGYQLVYRNGGLDITYLMRSSDFATHFDNDCWLAMQLQQYVANELDVPRGTFTHCLTSLHVYASEVSHAF